MLLLWLGDWAAGSTCEYQHARVALMFAALFLLLSPAHHCVCYTIPPCSPSAQAFAAAARRLPFFGFCQQCELDHFSHIGPSGISAADIAHNLRGLPKSTQPKVWEH